MTTRAIWDERCGTGLFRLVLAILVFTALVFGGVGTWEFLVVQALTAGVLALWIARLWLPLKERFLLPPIVWPALVFTAYAVERYLTSDVEYQARLELLQVLVYVVLFLAIINQLYHQDQTQTLVFTLIGLATFAASYAVGQYLSHSSQVWYLTTRDEGRATGTFLSADHFCAYLEMILPLVVCLLLAGRVKALTRVLLGYSLLVIMAGAALTFSRAGWVSLLSGLLLVLIILVRHRNHRLSAGIFLALLVAGGTWFVTCYLAHTLAYLQRVTTAKGGINVDLTARWEIWQAAVRMWRDNLWLGVGPGLFDLRFNEYRTQAIQLRPVWAHCDYLNLLTDWGLAGGLVVLAGLVIFLLGVRQTWPHVRRAEKDFGSGQSTRFAIYLGCLGGLAALAVHSLADFNLHNPADALVAVTLLAILSSNLRFTTERFWQRIRWPSRWLATLAFGSVLAYLVVQTIRLGQEAWWLNQASQVPAATLSEARLLERASQCEPNNYFTAYNIGESYRNEAFTGATDPVAGVTNALVWYQRSEQLNPHFALNYLREGTCLDFLSLHEDAEPCYLQADQHDPNGYFTAANVGWHYLHTGQSAAARPWLLRSLSLQPRNNPIASSSLAAVEMELANQAGNVQ